QGGQLNLAAAHARYTADVPSAARRLGTTPASVRAAIQARRLAGVFQNGQWWISEESLASYKGSNRGRRREGGKRGPTEPARAPRDGLVGVASTAAAGRPPDTPVTPWRSAP